MMKKSAPYSGARRKQNEKVAWNMQDVARGIQKSFAGEPLVDDKPKPNTSRSRAPTQQPGRSTPQDAARVLQNSSTLGKAAVDNVRKSKNKSADYLKSIGQ
jgi:hypothetical protein